MADARILLDTGPLVALLAGEDTHHARCVEALKALAPPLLTCWPVLTEAAWLLRRYPDHAALLEAAHAGGLFDILPLHGEDLPAIAAIMRRYADAGLQLADAALAHLAEREQIRTVFTLNRRDFSLVRLKRNRALNLIPEVQ